MNYTVPGEILARLLIAAGARLDADEVGEMVHRIRPVVDSSASLPRDLTDEEIAEIATIPASPEKPAKPEA